MSGAAYTADNLFLKLEYAATDFLVPLDDILHIEANAPEDACVLGRKKPNAQNCYVAVQGEGRAVYLTAHHIYGVVTVEPDRQICLPECAKTPDNAWIFAIAFDPETQKAMYLTDSRKIRQSEALV